MAAAATGKEELVTLLLAHGADINAKDKQGQSVLMWSALWNQPEIAQTLLDKGVSVDVSDNYGNTPLMMAVACPHAYEFLPDNVSRDQITLINILLRHGANINATNYKGDTALLMAQRHKMADVTNVLLANGVIKIL